MYSIYPMRDREGVSYAAHDVAGVESQLHFEMSRLSG